MTFPSGSDPSQDTNGAEPNPGLGAFFIGLVGFCTLIEAILSLADIGLFGEAPLRRMVFAYTAFWPGILDGWQPNFPLQSLAMFLTYGFLHGGLFHLIINMMALLSLAPPAISRVGVYASALIYFGSMIGGGLAYILLSDAVTPMVGASGALFGLAGAVIVWDLIDRLATKQRLWPVFRALGFLAVLNIVLYLALQGALAWEAHLGGLVAGAAMAVLIGPRTQTP